MDNPDRSLRYFVRIAELKSLSRAAAALDLTQSGLSRQLASLEDHLGKALFHRTGRGVELTPAGDRLFAAAKPAYAEIDTALETVRDREGITQGQVRLAVIHTLSYYFMAEVVADFVGQREHVNLSLMGRSSPEVVSLVEAGQADVGFVYDSAIVSDAFTTTPLFEDEMCLISSSGIVPSAEIDMTRTPVRLIGFPKQYVLRRMLVAEGMKAEVVAEAETIDAMLKLVASGIGACVLPSRIPDKLLVDYGLTKVPIVRPRMRRWVMAIVRRAGPTSPLVQALVDLAQARSR